MKSAKLLLVYCIALKLLTACGQDTSTSELAGKKPASSDHYQLNIIDVPKGQTASITSGNRIFVSMEGRTQVFLSEGPFSVIDGNGTDGSAAFRIPSPDLDDDGVTSYSVFVRPVGKPGGQIQANTCASDVIAGEEICSLESIISTRTKGKSTFSNVSDELLSISADLDGDGVAERVPLFDDRLKDYIWNVDNAGLKVLQLRFVEVSSTFHK